MPTTASSQPPVPLTTLTQQQAGNNNTSAPPTAPNNSVSTPNPAAQTQIQPAAVQQPSSRSRTWRDRLGDTFSTANGIGTFTLIAALVFGIGAWVGMKIQISQGAQNMDLAIWTACADHQAIQDTALCKSILAKDFSELGTRDVETKHEDVGVLVKREIAIEDEDGLLDSDSADIPPLHESRFSKLLTSLSPSDRDLINQEPRGYDYSRRIQQGYDPAIRATIFPLVNLLIKPVSWVFEFIEYILLVIIYCIHKVLSWMTWIILTILQAIIYSFVEKIIQQLLATLDLAIWQLMPTWMPYILASNVASCLGLSALRSFWYLTNYVNSLKWIFTFRLGMWVTTEAVKFGYRFWTGELGFSTFRKFLVERPRSQYELPSWLDTANQSPRPEGMVSSSATVPARSRSNGFAPQTRPLPGPPQQSSSGFARARGGRMTTYEGGIEVDEVNNRSFVDEL